MSRAESRRRRKSIAQVALTLSAAAAFCAIVAAGGCSSPAEGAIGGPCFGLRGCAFESVGCVQHRFCSGGLVCVTGVCQVLDGGPLDDGNDTSKPDTGAPDTGPMCPTPGDTTGFTPPTYIPAKTGMVCTAAQITDYVTKCWKHMGNCQMFKTDNAACCACLESRRQDPMNAMNDAKFGPVYFGNGLPFLNFAGCIELNGDLDCAKAIQAASFCVYTACDNACTIPPDTFANYGTCMGTAANANCKMYVDVVNTACATEAGASAYAACSAFSVVEDVVTQYGNLFCGGAPSDAGGG